MKTVLSAFPDRTTADAAADRLRQERLTTGTIKVFGGAVGVAKDPSLGHPLDELVTGGALTDFARLWGHLFGSAGATGPETNMAELVDGGGAVVSVDARDAGEAERVLALLLQVGATKQAFLPQPGDLS